MRSLHHSNDNGKSTAARQTLHKCGVIELSNLRGPDLGGVGEALLLSAVPWLAWLMQQLQALNIRLRLRRALDPDSVSNAILNS